MRFERGYELIAIQVWHLYIANDQVWSFPQDGMTAGDGIFRREHFVTGITQMQADQLPHGEIVVYDDYLPPPRWVLLYGNYLFQARSPYLPRLAGGL